jgi:ribonuclease HI/exonuclease III
MSSDNQYPPSAPGVHDPSTTSTRHQQNPYASTFRFVAPSDFAPTRRSPGGIRLISINVQSISSPALRESIADVFRAWDLDILVLVETWLRPREATALNTSIFHATGGARSYSTVAPETDNRHLGVSLILHEEMARHVQHIDTIEGTAVRARLRWRRRELHIIAVYVPPEGPNNAARERATTRKVTEWLREAESTSAETILLGDLNDCANPAIDRHPPADATVPPHTGLMRYLTRTDRYTDIWRERHGRATAFTYPHNQPSTSMARLDYIWTSPALTHLLNGVGIAESRTDLGEGHRMVCAELATQVLFPKTRSTPSPQTARRPRRLDTRRVDKARWLVFQTATQNDLPDSLVELVKAAKEDRLPADGMDTQETFDLIEELESHMLACAAAELPHIQPGTRRKQAIRDADWSRLGWRLSHIKKNWENGGRRALEQLVERYQPALDRAEVPSLLQERLKQLAAPTEDTDPDRTSATPVLNATIRALRKARIRAAAKRLHFKIREAIHRRCERFLGNVGAVLRSLKRGPLVPNTQVDRALFTDDDGAKVLETDAEAVLARVRTHFESWFGPRDERLAAAPEYIRREYQPLPDIEPAWFDALMSPITEEELEDILQHLPRGKAPGKSGLANELWIHAGPECKEAFRLLLNECLRHEDIPTTWKQSLVIPIPKTTEFAGDLDKLRPIALLETSRKVLSAVLTRRLRQVIEQRQVLRGFNLGFRANRQAQDLAFSIQGMCEASRVAEKPIDMLSLDVRRAYDSVSLSTLQHSLRRIRVPEGYIRMLSTIHTSRTAQIWTAHGLTQPYSPVSGLDQGEINAPTLWLVIYDPLLCLLERSGQGIRLGELVQDTPAMRKIHPGLCDRLRNRVIFGGAYADDLTLMASSRANLQVLADICNDWFEANGIELNPTKSVHLSHDPVTRRPTEGSPIQLGNGTRRSPVLQLQPSGTPLRVLGMYVVPDGTHRPMYEMCKELASSQARMLRSRAMTDKIALFVLSAVMMPALTYKMQGHAFTCSELHQIAKPLMQALKHACQLPITFPSSFMHHRLAGKVPRLGTVHTANNLTLLVRAMNAPSPISDIVQARIAATEHRMRFPGPMLEIPWLVRREHGIMRKQRPLIPALAMALDERGTTLGTPTYSPQWLATNALQEPQQWLFDAFRKELPRRVLEKAYNRACIWASDVIRCEATTNGEIQLQLQPQPRGSRPAFIREIAATLSDIDSPGREEERRRLLTAVGRSRSPEPHNHEIPFTLQEIIHAYGQDCRDAGPEPGWVVYTDGSVAQRGGRSTGSFAGTFTQGPAIPINFRGRVTELPLSSTRMETMAIITAVVITPPPTPLVIHTDSQAAMSMVRHAMAPVASRELYKSPDAFLWLHFRSWLQRRQAPTTVTWVRGHSGDAGNEMADRLAASAHDDPSVILWTTQMPPPPGTPFWTLHGKRVISRSARRLCREQDQAITAERLVYQINEVSDRPLQTQKTVGYILHALRGTIDREGKTRMKKCWNITNPRDGTLRAFGYKLLMGFLPTLERQQSWYPQVYNRQELVECAKCKHPIETIGHIFVCADHSQVERYFRDSFWALQPQTAAQIGLRWLQPWSYLGSLQGCPHPYWEFAIPLLQHDRRGTQSTAQVIVQLLRASFETWYHAIWLPRCQRTIERERSLGLHQREKIRRMRAVLRAGGSQAPPSPTPKLPSSFLDSIHDRRIAYRRYLSRLMPSISGH